MGIRVKIGNIDIRNVRPDIGVIPDIYCAEYRIVYDSLITKPSDAIALQQNLFVKTCVDAGSWAKIDWLIMTAQTTNGAGEALKNWKLPGTFDATLVNAPAFAALEGFTGAATKYINTNWIPSVNGINFVQNSASQILYSRTDVPDSIGAHGSITNADTKDIFILPRSVPNAIIARTNDATTVFGANANGSGMYINTRTAAAVNKVYKNKVALINAVTVSTGAPTCKQYCLAANDDGVAVTFRSDQISLYAFGGGLTQADVNVITDAFEVYMDSNGKGVIP